MDQVQVVVAQLPSRTSKRTKQTALLAQRLERGAHLGGEKVWLFPGREVTASVEPVVVDEVVGVRTLGPAPQALMQLARKDASGRRNRDRLGVEEVRAVLPVQAGRGNPGARQPVQRDVVEKIVSR